MWGDHPKVDLPKDRRVTILNSLILVMIIGSIIYSIFTYRSLPDEVPIHFNLKGEADNWGHPGFIFLMQFISLPMYLIVYVLSRMPHMHNYSNLKVTEQNAPQLYTLSRLFLTVLNFEAVLIFSYLSWEMIQMAKGQGTFGSWVIPAFIGLLIVTIVGFWMRLNRFKESV